tara:strand:- start:1424 stop:1756 length:333 start_codon:yes stop_codon:yes gene_type:complete
MTAEAFWGGVYAGTGDETQHFDNDLGDEPIVFIFNTAGTFQFIDLRFIDDGTADAVLSFDGGGTFNLFPVGLHETAGGRLIFTLLPNPLRRAKTSHWSFPLQFLQAKIFH